MRMRRAQHKGVGLAGQRQIVDVTAAASQKTPVLDAADRLANAELVHGDATSNTGHIGCIIDFAIAQTPVSAG